MLAIHAPAAIALITPARRDRPRPAAIVRSASGPLPKTSLLPSGIPTTRPEGVVTRAAAGLLGWDAIVFLSGLPVCVDWRDRGSASVNLGAMPGRSRNPGIAGGRAVRLATGSPGWGAGTARRRGFHHAERRASQAVGRARAGSAHGGSLPARSLGGTRGPAPASYGFPSGPGFRTLGPEPTGRETHEASAAGGSVHGARAAGQARPDR